MDIYLLQLCLTRKKWLQLSDTPQDMLEGTTQTLLKWYAKYYKEFPEAECIDLDALKAMLCIKIKDDTTRAILDALIQQLNKPLNPAYLHTIEQNLIQEIKAGRIRALLAQYDAGQEVDLLCEVRQVLQDTQQQPLDWERKSILECVESEMDTSGLNLMCFPKLGQHLKGLRGGDNVLIAAPTDKGKTWFMCRLAVHLAQQLHKMGDPRPVLYCTNEHRADRILPRLHKTALEIPMAIMYDRLRAGEDLDAEYTQLSGGGDERIRCINIHGYSVGRVVALAAQHNAAVLITDMTQRISLGNSKGSEHQDIEEVWDRLRTGANQYDFVHIGSAQISAEGFDNLYPPLSALKQSKAGIQNTLDLAIYLGALDRVDPSVQNMRGLSTPKNKLVLEGHNAYIREQVYFDSSTNTWS